MSWWDDLSENDRRAYLSEHPGSAHAAGGLVVERGAKAGPGRRTAQDVHRYLGPHAVVTHRANGDVHVRSAVGHPRLNKALANALQYHGVRGTYSMGRDPDPGFLIHRDVAAGYGKKGLRFPNDPETARGSDWFDQLSRREQREYVKAHPHSKYAVNARAPIKKPTTTPSETKSTPADFLKGTGVVLLDPEEAKDVSATWNKVIGVKPRAFTTALLKGTNLRPTARVDTYSKGPDRGIDLELFAHDRDGRQVFSASRVIYRNEKERKLVAYHSVFKVEDAQQGGGVAKHFLRSSVAEYKRMGVDRVEMNANIDVGGYAWARYGFVPSQDAWPRLRNRLRARLKDLGKAVPPEARAHLDHLLQSDDPRVLWDVADLTAPVKAKTKKGGLKEMSLGKHMLLGSNWDGQLKLGDKTAMARFDAYVGKK